MISHFKLPRTSRCFSRWFSQVTDLKVQLDPCPPVTLGFVCLPTDITSSSEIPTVLSQVPGVSWRINHLPAMKGGQVSVDSYMDTKNSISPTSESFQPADSVSCLALACTDFVEAELQKPHPNSKVATMAGAQANALATCGYRNVALLTPYISELAEKNVEFLTASGINVIVQGHLGLKTDGEIFRVSQECILESAKRVLAENSSVDALVIGCNALRTLTPGFLDSLERTLGVPVVSSLQCLIWDMLRLSNVNDPVHGFGSLLRKSRISTAAQVTSRPLRVAPPRELEPDGSVADVYPSRPQVGTPRFVDRIDPVVDPERINDGPLSSAQIHAYDKQGYTVLKGVFSPAEIKTIRERVEATRRQYEANLELVHKMDRLLIAESAVGGEGSSLLKSIWMIHKNVEDSAHLLASADILYHLCRDERLLNVAHQIIGEDVYIHQSRINFQQGYNEANRMGGTGFLWHQDFEQWHSDDGMPRMRALSMAVLLDDNRPYNGALMVSPGSHRQLVQPMPYSPNPSAAELAMRLRTGPILPNTLFQDVTNRGGLVHCSGDAGDVVMFDCNLIHGSHTNISPWNRQNLFFVYNAISNTINPHGGYDLSLSERFRPEQFSSRDPKYAGVPLIPRPVDYSQF